MPELPDVENYKRHLDRTAIGKTIAAIAIDDDRILEDVGKTELGEAMTGNTLARAHRHGKQLFAAIDDGPWLTLHFGMTGRLEHFGDDGDEPEHDRLRIDFTDGSHLAFVNQRLFGEIGLVDDPAEFVREHRLGPDAMDDGLDADAFVERLSERRGQVKSALMNQSVVAGIGNVYSDEILFRARHHPKTPLSTLDEGALKSLHRTMRHVLDTAIESGAGSRELADNLPGDWLLTRREEGADCPRCDGRIATVKAAGRTAYLCPKCQPQPED